MTVHQLITVDTWESFLTPSSPLLPVIPNLITQQALLFLPPKSVLTRSTPLHLRTVCLLDDCKSLPANPQPLPLPCPTQEELTSKMINGVIGLTWLSPPLSSLTWGHGPLIWPPAIPVAYHTLPNSQVLPQGGAPSTGYCPLIRVFFHCSKSFLILQGSPEMPSP